MIRFIIAFVLASGLAYGVTEWNEVNFKDLITVDNIQVDGNTISTTDTNGNLNLEPDGTGQTVSTKTIKAGEFNIGGTNDATSLFDVTSTTKGTRPFPSMTEAQRDAISTPATGLIVFNTDTNQLNQYNGTEWGAVAGGGDGDPTVRNYVVNPTFDTSVEDVTVTANITKSQETVNPIAPSSGGGSLKLTIATAATTADYADIDLSTFAKADTDTSKNIIISFEYYNDSNFSTDDVQFVLRNNTDSEDIIPLGDLNGKIQYSENTTKYVGYVQTDASITDYSLRMNVLSAPATASNIVIDTVKVGPDSFTAGAIMSEWQSYTPTGSWTTNTIYSGRWRRVGDSMEIEVGLDLSGAPNTADLTFDLPSGYTIDTSKVSFPSGNESVFGTANIYDSVTRLYTGSVVYGDTNSVFVTHSESGNIGKVTATAPITFAANDNVNIRAVIPIEGWDASTLISSTDALMRSARAKATMSSGAAVSTSLAVVPFNTKVYDNLNAYNTSGHNYTIQKDGLYSVGAMVTHTANANNHLTQMAIVVNGVIVSEAELDESQNTSLNYSKQIFDDLELEKGDVVDIRYANSQGGNFIASEKSNYFYIRYNPDLTSAGVYGGSTTLGPYDLTVTGTNWTTEKAVATFETIKGNWFMDFTLSGTISSATTSIDLTVADVSIDSEYTRQALSAVGVTTTTGVSNAWYRGATNTIEFRGTSTSAVQVSGRVQLSGKPAIID